MVYIDKNSEMELRLYPNGICKVEDSKAGKVVLIGVYNVLMSSIILDLLDHTKDHKIHLEFINYGLMKTLEFLP